MISDLQKRRVAFSKRCPTLFKKAEELAILTGSDLFLGVRSSTGRTFYSSYQRGKLIESNIAHRKGKVNSVGHGDCESFWTSPVNSATGGTFDSTSSGLNDDEFNMDELLNFSEDCIGDGDRPENSAIRGPSNPTCSGLDGSEFNPDAFLDPSEDCIGHGNRPENSTVGGGSNPDDFPQLEDLDVDLDIEKCPCCVGVCVGLGDGILSSPENSDAGGGRSGVELMRSGVEGDGYDPNDFLTLEDLGVSL